MEYTQEIRWKQRFSNYEKALNQLTKFVEKKELNEFEIQGLIQCFEYTYELAWNTLKDFLEFQGHNNISGSRDAISVAFKFGLINNGEQWMEMFKNRNLTSHTYNEDVTEKIAKHIYTVSYSLFLDLRDELKDFKFGLKDDIVEKIQGVFQKYSEVEKVIIYGSRAKGNYKKGSDIDLTMFGENLTFDILLKISADIDELYLPYSFDISIFNNISNQELVEHIERVGIPIYDTMQRNI